MLSILKEASEHGVTVKFSPMVNPVQPEQEEKACSQLSLLH